MIKLYFLLIPILFPLCIFANARVMHDVWTLSIKAEFADPKDQVKKSVLRFENKAGDLIEYVPEKLPWGSYRSEEKVLSGRRMFITYWAHGAKNVFYRIFDPNHPSILVCEFISEAEEPKIRAINGKFEFFDVRTTKTGVQKKWSPCPEITKDRQPLSVKRHKKISS